MGDRRSDALADCEAIIAAHQPDYTDNCPVCAADGVPVRYPCLPLLFNEDAADRLRRRIHRTKGDVMPGQSSTGWRKSSLCDNSGGNCVEIKTAGGAFAVRDSKDPDGPVLVFGAREWHAFVAGVRNNEFDA